MIYARFVQEQHSCWILIVLFHWGNIHPAPARCTLYNIMW